MTIPLPNLQNYHLFFILCILIHSQLLCSLRLTFIYSGILHFCSRCTLIAIHYSLCYSNLLSLSNSASGTHLAIADKVLLLDPITGSKEEAKAQDAQAIGRSHRMGQSKQVTVVRFIVQDSIEQEDYERIYETSL